MGEFLERARNRHDAIRKILMGEWDPIGISHKPNAQDEYDAYVAEVSRLLMRRESAQTVLDYLWWVEVQHMGLAGDLQRTRAVADRLVALVVDG